MRRHHEPHLAVARTGREAATPAGRVASIPAGATTMTQTTTMRASLSRRSFLASTVAASAAAGTALVMNAPAAAAVTGTRLNVFTPAEDTTVFANPDRGLMTPQESHWFTGQEGHFWHLSTTDWSQVRAGGSSLIFRNYYLDDWFSTDTISAHYLDLIRADMNTARANGMKMVVQFAYRKDGLNGFEAPYGDSPGVDRVMKHAAQLVPVINEGADVIFALYQGFYGLWGENCYSDAFTTSGDIRNPNGTDWTNRLTLLNNLLSAAPDVRFIQARFIGNIEHYVARYGDPAGAGVSARLGIHNDSFGCFPHDYGTYDLTSSRSMDTNRAWMAQRALVTPYGGENQAEVLAPCDTYAGALPELSRMHLTYLNGWNVPRGWGDQTDLKKRLGYRLVARQVRVSSSVRPGSTARVEVDIENIGFAPPVAPRPIKINLELNGQVTSVTAPISANKLVTGTHTIAVDVPVPATWTRGAAAVSVSMPDSHPRIAADSRYAIRLANQGWDATTGRHVLASVAVDTRTTTKPSRLTAPTTGVYATTAPRTIG